MRNKLHRLFSSEDFVLGFLVTWCTLLGFFLGIFLCSI